jgi:hypothetical protein
MQKKQLNIWCLKQHVMIMNIIADEFVNVRKEIDNEQTIMTTKMQVLRVLMS